MKKILLLLIFLLNWLIIFTTPTQAAASLSLSPGSGNFGQGSTFVVTVNVNTGGEAVNAVEAVLTFPSDKLKANYISHSGSAFDINAESTLGNGVVKISKGKLPPAVVGSRKVAGVGFTAIGQGTATISASGSVLRESDSANILGGGASASFNIGAGAPVVQQQTSQATSQQQIVSDKEAPKISEIEVLNLGFQTATISWKTDEKADSQVEYGFVENRDDQPRYFLTVQLEKLVTEHKVDLDPKTLIPGHLYHFKVFSVDGAGNQTASEDMTFVVLGYSLVMSVVDQNSKAISNALVKLPSIGLSMTSDESGRVEFVDLPTGNLPIIVDYQGTIKETSTNLLADKNQATIVLEARASKVNFLQLVAGLVALVIVLGAYLFFRLWKARKLNRPPSTDSTSGV